MTELKFFQIRDRGTCIPTMCVQAIADDTDDSRELRRAGFGKGTAYYLLTNLVTMQTLYDPFRWDDRTTMLTVHRHIAKEWPWLTSGAVLDAEFIRGETAACKQPE